MKSLSPNRLASASGGGAVQSVNTQTGAVNLDIEDINNVQLNQIAGQATWDNYHASGGQTVDGVYYPATNTPVPNSWRTDNNNVNVNRRNSGLADQTANLESLSVGDTVTFTDSVGYSVTDTITAINNDIISSGGTYDRFRIYFSSAATFNSNVNKTGSLTIASTRFGAVDVALVDGDILQYNSTDSKFKPAQLPTIARAEVSGTTASIADAASANLTITNTGKAGQLLSIETDAAAWVTVYASQAARTADASRTETTDPTAGSGVIAEVITTGAQTVLLTPGATFFNSESTPASELYLKVVNKSGSSAAITVTFTKVAVEL